MLACRPARAQRLEVVPDAGLSADLAHGFEVVADGDLPADLPPSPCLAPRGGARWLSACRSAAQRFGMVPDAGLPADLAHGFKVVPDGCLPADLPPSASRVWPMVVCLPIWPSALRFWPMVAQPAPSPLRVWPMLVYLQICRPARAQRFGMVPDGGPPSVPLDNAKLP